MKITLLILLVCTLGFTQNKFEGIWERMDSTELIKIYKEGDYYFAQSLQRDDETLLLNQMVLKEDSTLYGGTYYDVENNSEIEAKVKLIEINTIEIKLYKKGQLFHDKLIFKRKTNAPESITYKK